MNSDRAGRLLRLIRSVTDVRAITGFARFVNHYNYDHIAPRRRLNLGDGVRLSPTVSFRNAQRISIGSRSRIGDRCSLWAGNDESSIDIGAECSFGPGVFVTSSNYDVSELGPVFERPTVEKDVVIGDRCWIGASVVVLPGVTIGSDCVVAAGSVVTRDVPTRTVAAGVPARPLSVRS